MATLGFGQGLPHSCVRRFEVEELRPALRLKGWFRPPLTALQPAAGGLSTFLGAEAARLCHGLAPRTAALQPVLWASAAPTVSRASLSLRLLAVVAGPLARCSPEGAVGCSNAVGLVRVGVRGGLCSGRGGELLRQGAVVEGSSSIAVILAF